MGKSKTSRKKNYWQLPQIPTINHHQDIRLCARTDGLPDQRQKHHLQFPTHQVDHPVADLLYRDVLPHVRPLHQHGQQVLPRMTDPLTSICTNHPSLSLPDYLPPLLNLLSTDSFILPQLSHQLCLIHIQIV